MDPSEVSLCLRRKMEQFLFQFEDIEVDDDSEIDLAEASLPSLTDDVPCASVKSVSLVYEGSLRERPCLTSTQEAKAFFRRYWKQYPGNDQERFVVACLDTKHRVQCVVVITIGTLDASLVHPREVFKPAILEGSAAVVLSHNHPSGNPEPSREDIQVTDTLTKAGKLLGINVLDHIVYGDGTDDVVSIRET
jgi:DNA repair protein RadC